MTQTTLNGGDTAETDEADDSKQTETTVETLKKNEYARTADRLQLNGLMRGVNIAERYP